LGVNRRLSEDFEMATHNFIRWGGLIGIVAAVLLIAYRVLIWNGVLVAGGLTGLLFFVLIPFAIWALHAAQTLESRWLGLIGFVLVILGGIINIVYLLLSTAEFSGIEGARPVLAFFFNTIPLFYLGSPVFDVGLILFGFATLRARGLARWAGILLAASATLSLVTDIDFADYLGLGLAIVPAAVLTGVALAWMGWALWSRKSDAVGRAKTAIL
jgi:hypothetical protein